ncbi:chemotaxis protein CheC [Halodesulfurarchaeum sp. HSR-GB]|uniref:chemotaxis protein CheC n=1 Tax=Halodesulfurarchaeum sp. HSR-GB TaxID=3074077 RepID=UPI00285F6C43|nr:chemotaxis protein CheC [Halodesulfurarchaeum sp. HSR-GB]MDR5656854.1 chemotaxis protein CheC [Halodesulfurarchaeum sp. HSR-GB]
MRVDLASLGTFNRIGTAGATTAAEALATLTDAETFVETTKVNFAPIDSIDALVADFETAIAVEYEGGLEGHALLVFDGESADFVLSELAGTGPDPDPAYLNEVGNILTSSFVDGWAEQLAETIDISTPTTIEDPTQRVPDADLAEFSFVFESQIEVGTGHECRFYLLPDPTSFLEMLQEAAADASDSAVSVQELSTFIRLTAAGAETVAENLEAMTGLATDVAVTHLDFVPIKDVSGAVDESEYVGTVFEFSGVMDGFLAVLFEAEHARTVTEALVPGDATDEGIQRSAIEEIGNITASGFIDGWANALGTTIDHSVPDFVDDLGQAVLESVAVQLGRNQEFAYVFDVAITAEDPLTCRLFAFPDADGFQSVISALDEDLDVSTVERV